MFKGGKKDVDKKENLQAENIDSAAETQSAEQGDTLPEGVEVLDDIFTEYETKLAEAKSQSEDYLDKLRRNMAEFDNYRKRTIKEKAAAYDDGIMGMTDKLLPVLDNFELAISSAVNKDDGFYKGVEMILRQFKLILFDIGIEEIPAKGQQFDPAVHNAVMHIEDGALGENEIVDEIRKGYRYKDKIIRHSMVKVAN